MVIDPGRVFRLHLAIIAALVLANVPIAVMDGFGHHGLFGYSRLLGLDQEANIPSCFSSLALLACAVVAWANRSRAETGHPDGSAWGLLAGFFALLAIDEAAMLHELANRASDEFALGGYLTKVGVFVYLPVMIWLAARLFPFWLRQDRPLRVRLFAGPAIYVGSAFGIELIENQLRAAGVPNYDLRMRISMTLEETGEMLGVAVILYAFLRSFAALGGGALVPLAVRDGRAGPDRPD